MAVINWFGWLAYSGRQPFLRANDFVYLFVGAKEVIFYLTTKFFE
nr:MAG TPA: hypothetical protein [Caudoviricetes sp.]